MIESLIIAFSMYSKVPMPHIEWKERNMQHVYCFFPWVGAVIGGVLWCVGKLLLEVQVSVLFFAVCMTLIPLVITGGIHMDGFLDTVDALCSYGEKEKKLQILKDPHAGAFAIISCGCYLLWSLGIWSEAGVAVLPLIACEYMLSRTLSALSVVSFQKAKNTGLAAAFQDGAKRQVVQIILAGYLVLLAAVMFCQSTGLSILVLLSAMVCFIGYRQLCYRKFGGITGDLAGYFLQVCELLMLTITVIGAKFL